MSRIKRNAKRVIAVTKAAHRKKIKKNSLFRCGVQHTAKIRQELEKAGLSLGNTSSETQCRTLLRVLQYLGTRGLNTHEGVACGYLRIATRVQELEAEGYVIASLRETAISADGMVHNGIARYVLTGCAAKENPQRSFNLEEVTA